MNDLDYNLIISICLVNHLKLEKSHMCIDVEFIQLNSSSLDSLTKQFLISCLNDILSSFYLCKILKSMSRKTNKRDFFFFKQFHKFSHNFNLLFRLVVEPPLRPKEVVRPP
jgi:hypothetical protein